MEKQWLLPRAILPLSSLKHFAPSSISNKGMISFRSVICRYSSPRIEINESLFRRRNASLVSRALPGDFLSVLAVQRVATLSSLALMLTKGTVITKSLLLPLIVLQAPTSLISWIKSDYGLWTAFLGLLLRLFLYLPGELELQLMAMVLVITAPYKILAARGTRGAAIVALTIASYLGIQHFSWAGNITEAFTYRTVLPSLAIISLILASLFFLI